MKENKEVCLYTHEALHTTNLVSEMMVEHLVNHHYYNSKFNLKYNALIDKACECLAEAYQSIDNNDSIK